MRADGKRFGVLLAVAAGVLLLWLLMPADHNLFARARVVEPREDFIYPAIPGRPGPPLRLRGDWPYCWVTPRLLLTLHYGPTSIMTFKPRLVDLPTGRHLVASHLAELGGVYSDSIAFSGTRPPRVETSFTCRPSPDGAWILVPRCLFAGGRGRSVCAAVRADDSRQVEWRIPFAPSESVWLRDGRRCAVLGLRGSEGLSLAVCDLNRPEWSTIHAFDEGAGPEWNSTSGGFPALAGTLADGSVLAIRWSEPFQGEVSSARFNPDTEVERPHKAPIRVPAGSGALPLLPPVLSPAGDRIAWFVGIVRTPVGWPATRAFWTLCRQAPATQVALWTTRPDGGDPREIGVYTSTDEFDRPSLLQWTSDGRSLSFRHQGTLYKVQAQ